MTSGDSDPRAVQIKRLRLRAWRRGTKEMDLILGRFADAHLAQADDAALSAFESLLAQEDHDLFAWILGRAAAPGPHRALIAEITAFVADQGAVPG